MKIGTRADVPELFVVDASIAVKWLVTEHDSNLAIRFAASHDLIAPLFMRIEVANILWKYVRRNIFDATAASKMLDDLDFWLQSHGSNLNLSALALQIACAYNHPVYDCIYLALANETGASFITADRKLANLAKIDSYYGCEIYLLDEYFTKTTWPKPNAF